MIKQIAVMGFDLDVAEYAAVKVEYRGVEEAVDLLIGRDE